MTTARPYRIILSAATVLVVPKGGRMMKLLIVAPNPQLRLLIRGLLAPFASEIYDCGAGAEALAVYRRQEPDCVLIDIDGPPRDGLETSRQIVSAFPEAHIVMLSDDDDARWRAVATAAGGRLRAQGQSARLAPEAEIAAAN